MNWALEIELGTKKSAKVLGAAGVFMTVYEFENLASQHHYCGIKTLFSTLSDKHKKLFVLLLALMLHDVSIA